MSFQVELTARAERDYDRLATAYAANSRGNAEAFTAAFLKAVERLEANPWTCGIARESRHFPQELRHVLFGPNPRRRFRGLFEIDGETVRILAIRAPGERDVQVDDLT